MRAIPSIDLMGGVAVQLVKGQPEQCRVRDPDVFALAEQFAPLGPINVIDLDAALGLGDNSALIEELASRFPIHVGGGVRRVERAERLVAAGVRKVIVGTPLYTSEGLNRVFLAELERRVGRPRLVFAADCRDGCVCVRGWRETTRLPLFDLVEELTTGCSELLFTCVDQEGPLLGPDLATIERLVKLSSVPVLAAGGIGSLEDVRAILTLGASAVLGMSLYTGRVRLEALLEL